MITKELDGGSWRSGQLPSPVPPLTASCLGRSTALNWRTEDLRMIFMIELGRVVSSVTTMGTVMESRRESVDMLTENSNRKRKFDGGYVDRQVKKLKLDEEDTKQTKVSTNKNNLIFDLQSSDASIVLESENPTNVVDKWNDVVKVCSNNLEKLSLKDKIQKFGGRPENKENEHPVESIE